MTVRSPVSLADVHRRVVLLGGWRRRRGLLTVAITTVSHESPLDTAALPGSQNGPPDQHEQKERYEPYAKGNEGHFQPSVYGLQNPLIVFVAVHEIPT